MTPREVDGIEAALSMSLPPDYRRFLLAYPADISPDITRHEIYSSALSVIGVTQEARSEMLSETSWPQHMVVIGDSGCGDYYCLDLSQEPAPVVCWNHEIGDFEYTASSIEAWYKQVLTFQKGSN
jgi:hypothetical protein